jgi:SAM-dependent methyltransferase
MSESSVEQEEGRLAGQKTASKISVGKAQQFWQGEPADVHAMFQKASHAYLAIHEKAEILSYLPDLTGKRILDLASGIGLYTDALSKRGKELISVDLVPHFVAKNRNDHASCPNVSYLCADVRELDFKAGYFDFIFINWLFMYLEDPEVGALLSRLHRWLAPSGELFFRESCDLPRTQSQKKGYHVHYRPPSFYEALARPHFTLLREGYIRLSVDLFADPFQCFWLYRK